MQREKSVVELEESMLKIRKSVSGQEENKSFVNSQTENYEKMYAEYEDRLATEASNGNIDIEDCNQKLVEFNPEGMAYANFFFTEESAFADELLSSENETKPATN